MDHINKVALLGTLGADPVANEGGTAMKIRLATNSRTKDKETGEWGDTTEWHNLVLLGKSVPRMAKLLRKGDTIHVSGSVRYDTFVGKDGVKKYFTEIVCFEAGIVNCKELKSSGATTDDAISFP